MKFRKKPIVIDAVPASELIDNAQSDWESLPAWIKEAYDKGGMVFTSESIHIPTLEGTMRADRGDWVICGVAGEIYPCKPAIFEATYEEVHG